MKKRGKRIAWWSLGFVVVSVLGGFAAKDSVLEQWYLYKLEHGTEQQQKQAAHSLAELGSVRSVPRIMAIASEIDPESLSGHWTWEVLTVFLNRRDDNLLQCWTGALQSEIPLLRMLGARAVDEIRPAPESVVPFLKAAVVDRRGEQLRLSRRPPCCMARDTAVRALGRYGPAAQEACEALREVLPVESHGDPVLLLWAMASLDCVEYKEVMAKYYMSDLTEGLTWWDADTREKAATALGYLGSAAKEAMPALSDALQDENVAVRQAAAEALRKIQGHEEAEG